MSILVLAFLIGIISGLRTLMGVAVASWSASSNWFSLAGTPLNFMSSVITRWILTLAEVGELINDKLPTTPSRKTPPQFIARIVVGALAGATLGAAHDTLLGGLIAGAIGAVVAHSAEPPPGVPSQRPLAETFPQPSSKTPLHSSAVSL